MGVWDHVSDRLCSFSHVYRNKKPQQLQTVEIRVKMDCEGCERKVHRSVQGMEGVSSIDIDPKQHKLTVTGYVEPRKVVNRVRRKTGKAAELWPYVPYDTVDHPYAAGAYDKRAPAGYVRNVNSDPSLAPLAQASSTEIRYSTAFSEDNANSCAIM
ncbi:heavy metal-associated isoprenylated plant protein 27-like [Iris pallida]|uniref:Heavy metal-associated isoprenylated plant protein 27-like n=1 Tax=Iris pallida TaxID=29817 RepID=A0AAX6HG15_IRIPA|nr:heavy metal-associated isoprenylated plant protein 27-like [Iris pallida]